MKMRPFKCNINKPTREATRDRSWPYLDIWVFLLPFLTLKIKIFKIGKKYFLLMSQGPLIPKIMFPSQKLWPVASGQTDFWPKILIFGCFFTIFDPKNQNFQNRKKTFLLMSQGPLIPKIMFSSQKLWPVASGQTDRRTDVKVKTEDPFFRLQEFLPSAYDGAVQLKNKSKISPIRN